MKPGIFNTAVIVALAAFTTTNSNLMVTDYFNVPGPLTYDKTAYNLSWSSHPNDSYYKHEYLPAGQNSETFTKMVLLEAATGNISVADAVKSKTTELDQRKKTDAVTNYQVIENKNTGEYLLDFVVSESVGSTISIVEWNAYRYAVLKDKSGKKGVFLLGYTRRAYGNNATSFLTALKTERQKDIKVMAAFTMPVVTLKN